MNIPIHKYLDRISIINDLVDNLDILSLNELDAECDSMMKHIMDVSNRLLDCKNKIKNTKIIKHNSIKNRMGILNNIDIDHIFNNICHININNIKNTPPGKLLYVPQIDQYIFSLNGIILFGNLLNIKKKNIYSKIYRYDKFININGDFQEVPDTKLISVSKYAWMYESENLFKKPIGDRQSIHEDLLFLQLLNKKDTDKFIKRLESQFIHDAIILTLLHEVF